MQRREFIRLFGGAATLLARASEVIE